MRIIDFNKNTMCIYNNFYIFIPRLYAQISEKLCLLRTRQVQERKRRNTNIVTDSIFNKDFNEESFGTYSELKRRSLTGEEDGEGKRASMSEFEIGGGGTPFNQTLTSPSAVALGRGSSVGIGPSEEVKGTPWNNILGCDDSGLTELLGLMRDCKVTRVCLCCENRVFDESW